MTVTTDTSTSLSFSTWLPHLSNNPLHLNYKSLWNLVQQLHSSSTQVEEQNDHHENQNQIDPWERSFATNWLTRLMSISLKLSSIESSEESIYKSHDFDDWDALAAFAGNVLAFLTGSPATASQPYTRKCVFELNSNCDLPPAHSKSGVIEILIREDIMSYAAIGCQTWNSAPLLCRRIASDPLKCFPQLAPAQLDHSVSLSADVQFNTPPLITSPTRRSLKILELGAGTGLVGITTACVLARFLRSKSDATSPIDIELILTDYHPKVLVNLNHNLSLNADGYVLPEECESTLSVKIETLDWRELQGSSLSQKGYKYGFDVILGSDLVYEPQHATWASEAVQFFLKPNLIHDLTSEPPQPTFHLLLPLRPTFALESQAVHNAFGGQDIEELLNSTDLKLLPKHDCQWEEEENSKAKPNGIQSLQNSELMNEKSVLEIKEYFKEDGISFGQGCSDYQYLKICRRS
ncbi:uncharacterized protein MELLADRAFT_115750 [Melampsora larici-populina 98AG31]|uniref:FAM86 N-terminal domain-containing protein n=1 Tax=Melampsora larici-populina (strain 98AG31 / pathotype 3-4-7) TaxID=747676 RepID=F4RDP8_MELLP|nr:uncharacterized protein MELLADRAFT_115750 [Melampsora larici-populina 98AG31]EGG09567.1 hypothetical protein MELLADRAFT_115750 [Melampsora larici-populina 98AG31]